MEPFEVYSLYNFTPVKAEGSYVYSSDGKKILDFYGGHAVISIGHCHPHYVDMLSNQVSWLGFYSNSVENPLQNELAQKLGEQCGLEDYHLFLINSGAEANENALKLASFVTGSKKVIAFNKSFHGRTSAAVNITDNPKIKAPINHGVEVTFFGLEQEEEVIEALNTGEYAAIIIEGIQGIAGIYEPSAKLLQIIEKTCQNLDTLFILDEIQSGYGRSGDFFAYQRSGIKPDIVTTAKGMGNGFPIGGVLIHPKYEAVKGMLGTTFGGSHLACAAGISVLDVLKEESLVENARKRGEQITSELQNFSKVKEVRGRGLMIGIQCDSPISEMRRNMLFDDELFVGSAAEPSTIRLLPPLSVSEQQVDEALSILRKYLN